MKAGIIDLRDVRFTFDEVYELLGQEVDIANKYETTELNGADLLIDDEESDELQGFRVELYANKVSDITKNSVISEQRKRLFRVAAEKGAIQWQ